MKSVNINEIDLNKVLFHFDARENEYISRYGFPADIGPYSRNAEETPKVFFSKGVKGVLDLIDVWIIWRMNKDHNNSQNRDWVNEFLSGAYLSDYEKLNITFNNIYDFFADRKYYTVDLIEGYDYLNDDVDEVKKSSLLDKEKFMRLKITPWKYLFAKEMYKGKVKKTNMEMEDWNMHTISGKGVEPEKISLIIDDNGNDSALMVIKNLYSRYEDKNDFRILNEFMEYVCEVEKS